MSYTQAAEVASRTGAAQTVAAPKVKTTREAEAARRDVYFGNDEAEENSFGFGASSAELSGSRFTSADKKLARKQSKRRRLSELQERSDTSEARRSRGADEAGKVGKGSKTDKRNGVRSGDWVSDRGYRAAQDTLRQQELLQKANIQFAQARQSEPQGVSTPFGQQQAMLDSLISMTEMLYHQHTGDKAGEIYNRPATRQILTALKGLKDAAQPKTEETSDVAPRRMKKKEFRAQMARLEKVQVAVLEPPAPPPDYEPLDLVA